MTRRTAERRIPMRPCGNCKKAISRSLAKHQEGYCDGCQFMKTKDVLELLKVKRHDLDKLLGMGELKMVAITPKSLRWHRSTVEAVLRKQARRD